MSDKREEVEILVKKLIWFWEPETRNYLPDNAQALVDEIVTLIEGEKEK